MNHMMKVFGLVVLGGVLLGSGPLMAQDVMPEEDFFKVCKWGTVKQMNKALASGVDVNAKTGENMTALMLAAAKNPDPDVVRTLLESGADVYAKDTAGRDVLWYVQSSRREQGQKEQILRMLKEYAAR